MKRLILLTVLSLWTFNSLAQTGQAPMVKGMPFPFVLGMAMDTAFVSVVKAKLKAGDALQIASRQATDSLKRQIAKTQQVLVDQKALTRHDSVRAASFSRQVDTLQTTLETTQAELKTSDKALGNLYISLPRVLRYSLRETDPHTICQATAGYIKLLRGRKWYWGIVGLAAGTLTGIILKR